MVGFKNRHMERGVYSLKKGEYYSERFKNKSSFVPVMICLVGAFGISGVGFAYAQESNDTDDISTNVHSAKEQMEEEENYIVDLVSQRTGENLTTSDWEICLNYLRENTRCHKNIL